MAIIISENGKNARRVEPSTFGAEANLQAYIYDNPEAIPLYEISEDINLLILAREFPTSSGPIDGLGVDSSGNLYVIETKRHDNPDRRRIIAQALDYGASLWKHSTNFETFLAQLDRHTQRQFSQTVQLKVQDFFGLEETAEFFESLRINLNTGNIKYVVLMDKLDDRLKDIILYVNQNSQFDIYAVELDYYKHDSFEILIPKLFGAEVKKEVVSSRSGAPRYMTPVEEDDFWQSVTTFVTNGDLDQESVAFLQRIATIFTELSGMTSGTHEFTRFNTDLGRDVVKLQIKDTTGRKSLSLESTGNITFYIGDKSGSQIDFGRQSLNRMIEARILNRTVQNSSGRECTIQLRKQISKSSEIETLIEIFSSELGKLKE